MSNQASSVVSIFSLYKKKCLPNFNKLRIALEDLEDESGLKASFPFLMDQIGRLQAWAGHSGAQRAENSKMSLDYKLREASHMHSRIIALLFELDGHLHQTLATLCKPMAGNVAEAKQQLLAPASDVLIWDDSDSDDTGDSETVSAGGPTRSPEAPPGTPQSGLSLKKTRFDYLLRDIAHIITCLYELSITIQNPASRDKLYKYRDINVKHFEHFELLHARDKFPNAPQFLIDRVAKANLRRRQMLGYYRRHHDKLVGQPRQTKTLDKIPEDSVLQQHAPPLIDYNLDSTEIEKVVPRSQIAKTISTIINTQTTISTYIEPPRQANYDHPARLEVQSEAGCSQTSFASSAGGMSRLYIPSPPRDLDGTPFPCPYCFYIIRPKDSFSWMRHIVQDLQPYVCTFENCKKPDRLFEKRQEWYDHEIQVHRRHWFCMQCSQTYSTPMLLKEHLISSHHDLPEQLDLIIERCEGAIQSNQQCSFGCEGDYPPLILRGHLARHMQETAIFALPRLGDEDDTALSLASMRASWGHLEDDFQDLESIFEHSEAESDHAPMPEIEHHFTGNPVLFSCSFSAEADDSELGVESPGDTRNFREDTEGKGKAPLYYAAKECDMNKLKELITKGDDIPGDGGQTALHILAIEGDAVALHTLLEARAEKNIDSGDTDGMTPLHFAAKYLHSAVVYVLLSNGASPDMRDESGQTALDYVKHRGFDSSQIFKNRVDDVVWLLKQGINLRFNSGGESIFHRAASTEDFQMLERLFRLCVEHEPEVGSSRTRLHSLILGVQDNEGWTPLHVAARNGHEGIVRMLLEKGASVDVKKFDRWTPLHMAARNGHEGIVRMLLERGARVDVRERDNWTPLHMAARYGHGGVVRMLLEKGASVVVKKKDDWTPLHMAARNGHEGIVRILLERGASVDVRTNDRWAPLHMAARNGHEGIVRMLLERGARVDVRERDNWTPLHMAARNGHEGILRMLLEKGASTRVTNNRGETPLSLAEKGNHATIQQILSDKMHTSNSS